MLVSSKETQHTSPEDENKNRKSSRTSVIQPHRKIKIWRQCVCFWTASSIREATVNEALSLSSPSCAPQVSSDTRETAWGPQQCCASSHGPWQCCWHDKPSWSRTQGREQQRLPEVETSNSSSLCRPFIHNSTSSLGWEAFRKKLESFNNCCVVFQPLCWQPAAQWMCYGLLLG